MGYNGLSEKEAKKILEKNGRNELKDISGTSAIMILLGQIKSNFLIYFLSIAAIASFFVGKSITAYTIIAVIILVIGTGFFQEYRAEKSLAALRNMLLPHSVVIRDGREREILSSELVVGDIIVLRGGDRVPADCVIIEDHDLSVNESVLTGESHDITKTKSESKTITDENKVFMGTYVVKGKGICKIVHTGMNTKFGAISGLISMTEKDLPLQNKVNKIVKIMAIGGISASFLIALMMILRAETLNQELLISVLILFIAVAVSSFPEGFPAVLITILASGSYRMAKENAIVNRMSIIETLGETTVICSDKTGTITKGEMTVNKIYANDRLFELEGVGYEASGNFLMNNKKIDPLEEPVLDKLLQASILCNDTLIHRTNQSNTYTKVGSSTEAALLIMGAKAGLYKEDIKAKRLYEIPFNSQRKMMSVVCEIGKEKVVYTVGALEYMLPLITKIETTNGNYSLSEKARKGIISMNEELTHGSYRTVAIAYKTLSKLDKTHVEDDLIFLGLCALEDSPREGVKEAIMSCYEAGIQVKMITGDNKDTALAIGRQIGLTGKILEGKDLDNLTDDELEKIVKKIVIFARVKPEHKLRIVRALKANGEIVTMTGDGVNDAPALKEAHIGVAMGQNGTDVSRSVADLTLKDDNFTTIITAVKEGRTIFHNIQKFTAYQTSINVAQVSLIFYSILIGLPLPLVAIQILFMNLFSDELTAITLSFNKSSNDVMKTPPRRNSQIVPKQLLYIILMTGTIIALITLGVFYTAYEVLNLSLTQARTIAFSTMVFFGIMNAYNFRSFRKLTLNRSLMTNKYLFYVSLFVILITVFIVQGPIHHIFETEPIENSILFGIFILSLCAIVLFDIAKLINRKKKFLDIEHY